MDYAQRAAQFVGEYLAKDLAGLFVRGLQIWQHGPMLVSERRFVVYDIEEEFWHSPLCELQRIGR